MLLSFFGRSKPARKTTGPRVSTWKPLLEGLEDRTVPSAVVIETLDFSPSRTGAVAANTVTNRVYAAAEDVPAIRVIDSATNLVLAQVPTLGYHTGIAVNPATNRIYVSQQFARSVRVIDGVTNTIITDLAVPTVPGFVPTIGRLAVNPATHRLYVGENGNNIMAVFDTGTNAFLHQIALPTGYAGPDINIDTTLNRIYVTGRYTANVTILDGASEAVIAVVPTGIAPVSVAVDSVHHRAYVVNNLPETVSVIDGDPGSPTANTVVATIPVGFSPGVVGVNSTSEHVYVANNASHTVSIIDGTSNTVLQTLPMPAGAGTLGPLTVVPGNNRVYVAGEPRSLFVIEDAQCIPSPAGLVAWWSGEGDATDRTGLHNGSLTNGVTFAPGRVGQAFHLDGIDDYIRIPHDPALNPASGLTIEAWIKSESTAGPRVIASKWNDNTSDWSYIFKDHNSSDTLRIELSKSIHNDGGDLSGTTSIPTGAWVHVAAAFDGSTLRLYFNGMLDSSLSVAPELIDASFTDFLIGGGVTSDGVVRENFAGLIDELAIYNRALSAGEIRAIKDAGSAGKCVNQPPTDVALSNASVAEKQPAGTVVGAFTTTDPDAGETFSYTLVSGAGDADNGSFTIDASGNLKTAASFDFETKSSHFIRVRSIDADGLSTEKLFTIAVTNVNETPTDMALSNASVAENQLAGTTVGAFSTTDPDSGDSFTYTLVSGTGDADNGSFKISGNDNTLYANATFDFETKSSYSIRVRSTDAGSLSTEKVFTVTVTNVNEAPIITAPAAQTAFEDVDQTINGLSIGDPEGDSLTVTLAVGHGMLTLGTTTGLTVSGNGSGSVSLEGSIAHLNAALATLVYRGALNFSGADVLNFTATDGSLSTSGSVAIAVKSAGQQALDLQARVNALRDAGVLNVGQAKALNVQLNLQNNNSDIGRVQNFLNLVKDFFNSGILTQTQADELLSWGQILLLSVMRR